MNLNIKQFDIFYIIGLGATTVLMILELVFGFIALNFTFLIFFWIMKLLSGFGLILTVSNVILWILNRFTEKFSKKEIQALIIFQLIVPGILIGYAIYNVISSLPPATPPTGLHYWIDLIVFLYGILSFALTLYVIPLIKEEFQEATDKGIGDRVKRQAKEIGRKIKKGYFSLTKKYAKVHIQDQMTLGDVLNIWRNRFAVYFLIPIAIGSLIFTPVAFICIIFWLKIFVFDMGEPKLYERIALIISIIWIATISSLSYVFNLIFVTSIEPFFWTIQIFYLIGIVISTVIYLLRFIKLKGITIKRVKSKIRERLPDKEKNN